MCYTFADTAITEIRGIAFALTITHVDVYVNTPTPPLSITKLPSRRRGCKLALECVVENELGRVLRYRRSNGRSPVEDFLNGLDKNSLKKLKGEFETVTLLGRKHENQQRFKALTGKGKPLWAFKEFDHRIYCSRECRPNSDWVEVVLLYGWTKQKRGRHGEEDTEIENAKRLYDEYLKERQGRRK